MHQTYTFTPASSQQRVHSASKFIVEQRLCLSICPVHRRLSHVWQSIPEYCKFLFRWIVIFTNSVSLFFLFTQCWTCYIHSPINPNLYFPWQIYLWRLTFSLQSHFFYTIPLFEWKGGVSKWWTFRFLVPSKLSFLHLLVNN